jgi:Predicted ATPase of the PP-loop superfamily implicated in cell cycle control
MSGNLIERVLKTIRNYEMLKPGDTVLVAVSGGSDSIFLLHALASLKNKLKLKN